MLVPDEVDAVVVSVAEPSIPITQQPKKKKKKNKTVTSSEVSEVIKITFFS